MARVRVGTSSRIVEMDGLSVYAHARLGGLDSFARPSEHDSMVAAARALESGQRGSPMPSGPRMPSSLSEMIPPELRNRLPSAETAASLVLGMAPGSGDYMAARDALESSAASLSALGRGDYMGAGARGVDALAAGLGIMPFLPYLASIKGVKNPIRAYHGSPHDFDKFSMDKIGTGEGGQAYGHGLYFAENEGVARSYRNTLSPPPEYYTMPDGHKITMRDVYNSFDRDDLASTRALKAGEITRDWDKAEKYLRYRGDEAALEKLPFIKQYIDLASIDPPSGRMYEVNIHADPERFLDLDKPLSQQAQAVRDAAMRAITQGADDAARAAGISGADVAAGVANSANPIGMFSKAVNGPAMSDAMRNAGIPGVRYFDAMSRKPGHGTRNYVVFDDKLIEILRKYGIMAPVAGLGALAASGQDDPNL